MSRDQLNYNSTSSEQMSLDRLRELVADAPVTQKSSDQLKVDESWRMTPSWRNGKDEFDPDVQDTHDDHRSQAINSMEATLDVLQQLEVFLGTQDFVTNPKYSHVNSAMFALKTAIHEALDGETNPSKDEPIIQGGGNMDPSANGAAPVG